MWFIGVGVEQEMSAHPPKKNPGSSPVHVMLLHMWFTFFFISLLVSLTTKMPDGHIQGFAVNNASLWKI